MHESVDSSESDENDNIEEEITHITFKMLEELYFKDDQSKTNQV